MSDILRECSQYFASIRNHLDEFLMCFCEVSPGFSLIFLKLRLAMQRLGQLSRFVLALRLRKGWKCEGQEVVEV